MVYLESIKESIALITEENPGLQRVKIEGVEAAVSTYLAEAAKLSCKHLEGTWVTAPIPARTVLRWFGEIYISRKGEPIFVFEPNDNFTVKDKRVAEIHVGCEKAANCLEHSFIRYVSECMEDGIAFKTESKPKEKKIIKPSSPNAGIFA